jgi:hypothetical protein
MAYEDKNQTILSSKQDWEKWLQPIKSKALGTEVRDYINPDVNDKKELTEPEAPKKGTNETLEDFQYRRDLHKRALAKYDIKEAHIAAIREHIFKTIDHSANLLIQDKSTVRDILSELAKRYKPDTNREQFDILNKWTSLKTGPAGKSQLNAWIKDWIETYNRARQYKIPGIGTDEKYAMMEFMLAIQQSHEVFYSTWYEAVYNDRETSYVELITKFEDFTKSERGGSAYATIGSNKTDSNESNRNNSNRDKLCPCGQPKTIHPRWEECEYLNEQIRQDNWTADPTIIEKVAEEATSWKGLKSFIDQHKKQKRPPVTVNTVFRDRRGTNSLINSVIHDSGATESISNDLSRMEDFVPERIQIRGFGGSIWAEGRGTMVVWAMAPGDKEKSQELRIRNALYCPDGPISLISGRALNRNGIFKNEEKNVLYTRKGGYRAIAKLQSINDQAVIEYNPPNQALACALKAPKPSTRNKKHVYKNRSSKSKASKSQGVVGQEGQNKLNNTSDSQNKLNFKLTGTTSLDNRASRLPTPSSPDFEHRQEVVAHTGTEEEYPAPMTTERPGVGTEEQDSVRLFTPESNPSLNLRDFDTEVSQKLQMEAARELIEQASRANEISATFSKILHLSPVRHPHASCFSIFDLPLHSVPLYKPLFPYIRHSGHITRKA